MPSKPGSGEVLPPRHTPMSLVQAEDLVREKIERGDYTAAILALREALEQHRDSAVLWRLRSYVMQKLNRPLGALAAFTEALRCDPDDLYSLCERGHLLRAQSRWDETIEMYTRALEIEPENLEIQTALADVKRSRMYRRLGTSAATFAASTAAQILAEQMADSAAKRSLGEPKKPPRIG